MFSLASFALLAGYVAVIFANWPDRSTDDDDHSSPQVTQGDNLLTDTAGDDLRNALGWDDQVTTATGTDTVAGRDGDDRRQQATVRPGDCANALHIGADWVRMGSTPEWRTGHAGRLQPLWRYDPDRLAAHRAVT